MLLSCNHIGGHIQQIGAFVLARKALHSAEAIGTNKNKEPICFAFTLQRETFHFVNITDRGTFILSPHLRSDRRSEGNCEACEPNDAIDIPGPPVSRAS